MRRVASIAVALLVTLTACASGEPGPFDGFHEVADDEIISYKVEVWQRRTAKGLGDEKSFSSKVTLSLEEEGTTDGYAIVVRDVAASGEVSQKTAAQRLRGRRVEIDLREGSVLGAVELFAGSDDLAAADIGMLHAIFGPVLPSARSEAGTKWRATAPPIEVPWAASPLRFTLDHEITRSVVLRDLEVAAVRSTALSNVRFRLPLVEQAPSGSAAGGGSGGLVVNQLFDQLFGDIDNPAEGLVAAIAAIPLAIAAPLLAFGEALGSLFGGSSDSEEPKIPVVDLAGPLELTSTSDVWRADGRVLRSSGKGTSRLTGTLPELSGGAAELSGKPLTLSTSWTIERRLTSPWPQPRPIPGRGLVLSLLAVLAVVLGVFAATMRTRRLRLDAKRTVRDTVIRPPAAVDEPELADA